MTRIEKENDFCKTIPLGRRFPNLVSAFTIYLKKIVILPVIDFQSVNETDSAGVLFGHFVAVGDAGAVERGQEVLHRLHAHGGQLSARQVEVILPPFVGLKQFL